MDSGEGENMEKKSQNERERTLFNKKKGLDLGEREKKWEKLKVEREAGMEIK